MSQRQRHKHSASVFVVLLQQDRVCMLRRTGTGWMDGAFSLPAGGLEANETIAMAAVREAREEVSVEIDSVHLEYARTLHSMTEGTDWVGHFFTVRSWTGTPRVCERDKHGDLTWCPIKSLPAETIPYVRQALLCIDAAERYSEFGWLHGCDP